ncbi:MAG: hypothetical protein HRT88_17750 [Lentisphaeraceae bacterium]|nr:hypothetical protein [Lentisphaeraceae bacterium]
MVQTNVGDYVFVLEDGEDREDAAVFDGELFHIKRDLFIEFAESSIELLLSLYFEQEITVLDMYLTDFDSSSASFESQL